MKTKKDVVKKSNKKNKYVSKTEEELKKLATDIYSGLVFTDKHMKEGDSNPFMVLNLMDHKDVKELSEKCGCIYEYLSSAGPRSVNGRPSFLSFQLLDKADAKIMWDKYFKIKEVIEKV